MNVNPAHRDHDELLIARMASGDADAVDRAAGERQLASCEDCRVLLADVQAIRSFTTRDILRVPSRPRSFRIPPDELAHMGAPSWRRWLARFGAQRFDLVRPLATAVAGLGLVVVVLGSVPLSLPSFGFGAAALPLATTQEDTAGKAATPGPGESSAEGGTKVPVTIPPTAPSMLSDGRERLSPAGEPASLPLAPLGAIILVSGLGLVVLSTAARRAAGR